MGTHALPPFARPLALAVVLFALLLPGPARAAPAVDGPGEPMTMEDVRDLELAFYLRTMRDEYLAVGDRDPAWDEAAQEFLTGLCHTKAAGLKAGWHDYPDQPTEAELDAAARRLVDDLGCADPLVRYYHAVYVKDEALARAACRAVLASDYGPYRKLAAANYLLILDGGADALAKTRAELGDAAQWRDAADDLFLACVDGTLVEPGTAEEYLLWTQVARLAYDAGAPAPASQPLMDRVSLTNAHPWLVQFMLGKHGIRLAWDARGGGWANQVDAAGWAGFEKHLAEASANLHRAHELRPDFPFAATELVTVGMAGHLPPGEDERQWFDAAVAAQPDYDPAWSGYLWSLYPRWGGSHQAMIDLGIEAAQTDRHDTAMPLEQFYRCVRAAVKDNDRNWEMLRRRPDLWPVAKALYDDTIEEARRRRPGAVPHYERHRALWAWRSGAWADAAALLAELEPGPELAAAVAEFGGLLGDEQECHVRASPAAGPLVLADRAAARGDHDGQRRALEAALAALPENHAGRAFLGRALAAAELSKDAAKGPVEVPMDPAAWHVVGGTLEARDGTLVLTPDPALGTEAVALLPVPLGPDGWALALRFAEPTRAHAGLVTAYRPGDDEVWTAHLCDGRDGHPDALHLANGDGWGNRRNLRAAAEGIEPMREIGVASTAGPTIFHIDGREKALMDRFMVAGRPRAVWPVRWVGFYADAEVTNDDGGAIPALVERVTLDLSGGR